ncbi:hypothetical protein J8273_4549 [Carpediemonas membranifera]|uniref:G protein gamma domain-containing protein n=1 Tax=Carpediemonas membranifera TaxID=201153 RepID=A0A8J6B464_9EUKA|nr:hypothetical protein J8273_4549 [Carpediemonas membranifera]|eukprot:KAG9393949.1 hypothetical protein J8273_4549 [Carpediemonas membranifera]
MNAQQTGLLLKQQLTQNERLKLQCEASKRIMKVSEAAEVLITYITGKEDPLLTPGDSSNPFSPKGGCFCL